VVRANASRYKAMSYGRMKQVELRLAAEVQAWLDRAAAADTAENAWQGADHRGDEMPDWVWPTGSSSHDWSTSQPRKVLLMAASESQIVRLG
jgi:hypothetical protein